MSEGEVPKKKIRVEEYTTPMNIEHLYWWHKVPIPAPMHMHLYWRQYDKRKLLRWVYYRIFSIKYSARFHGIDKYVFTKILLYVDIWPSYKEQLAIEDENRRSSPEVHVELVPIIMPTSCNENRNN